MGRKRRLLVNTGLLTVSALVMRAVAMAFQAWLASRIGAAGIGLYQLTGSVTVLFSTLSVSGIRFAATRLVSEESGLERGRGVRGAMTRCLGYGMLFGLLSGCLLYFLAEPLGFLWVEDARTVKSLRIAAMGLPCLALSSVFCGYFTASGRVWKAALVQFLEQLLGVALVVTLLRRCVPGDMESICAAVTGGNVAAGILGLLMLIPLYLGERKRWKTPGPSAPQLTRRMLGIALPLAVSSYARTALSTLEHLLIPRGLRLSGLGAETALAGYGVVHGMALPAVLFPACLLFALAELLVPELTEAQVQGDAAGILRMVRKLRIATLWYALLTGFVLLLLAQPIAEHVFHTPEAAHYIRMFAPLVPIMNLDTVTDGCLRGLGQQGRVMIINILDAAMGVVLVWFLLPRYGLLGYIVMIWVTETGNFLLSFLALHNTLNAQKNPGQ